MFVKMHRIITQKTCHLFSTTAFRWLRVSQLIMRERIDLSESQNEPLWWKEISLTVFGRGVFTRWCGKTLQWELRPTSVVGRGDSGDIWRCHWRVSQMHKIWEILNVLLHPVAPPLPRTITKCSMVPVSKLGIRSGQHLQLDKASYKTLLCN